MENNADKKFDKLVGVLKSVSLTDAEKLTIKESLLNFANDSIVRNSEARRPIYARSLLTNIFFKRMPIALLVAMFLGGGVSFAAEGSLPGSFLYPVKTEVNERVGEVLAFSTEAKAKFEAKLLNKRAEEMEKLAERGELSPERAAKLKARFEIHSEKVRERLAELEASGKLDAAIEANSDLETHLKARVSALSDIVDKDNNELRKAEVRKWLTNIKDEDGKFGDIQSRIEAKIKLDGSADVEARAEGKLKAAENKIEEVAKFVANHKASANTEAVIKAEAQLAIANRLVAEGEVKLEAKAYGEAFLLFHKAHAAATEAQRMMINGKEKAGLLNMGIKADIKLREEKREEKIEERKEEREEMRTNKLETESEADVHSDDSETRGNAKIRIGI